MTDFEAQFAESLDTAVEGRLQHIQEMEQARLDRAAERNAARNPPQPEPETNVRLSIRERIVQQTQSQRPSAQRRARQHPRRAASFHTGDTNVQIANDIQNFREAFEISRNTIFAGMTPGSSENITDSQVGRRTVDLSGNQEGSQPNSGSSTPRISRRGENYEPTRGLDNQFAGIVADLSISRGSNSNLSDSGREHGSRSSSATRDHGRSNTSTNYQRFLMSNTADIGMTGRNGRYEGRRSRMTERRRQTIGITTSDVREAVALTSGGSRSSDNQTNSIETRTSDIDNIGLSRDTYPSNLSRYSRKIEIHEDTTRPVLALGDEKVVYVDEKGHCHWLEKNHPLLKAAKESSAPSVVIKYKTDSPTNSETPNDSVIDVPGDPEERYNKLRELIMKSKSRKGSCGNGDFEEIANGKNGIIVGNGKTALDETDSNNSIKKLQTLGINPAYSIEAIDKTFKHVSYYTKPRPRPSLDSYKLTRKCKSIYDYEGSEQSENTHEERTPISQQDSILTYTESGRQNGYHISVTDTVETASVVNTVETVIETREQINQFGALNRSNLGIRSESAFLRRSASVQESRPPRSEFGETPNARLVRHGSDLGIRSESTFLRRSASAQESRPPRSESGATPNASLARHRSDLGMRSEQAFLRRSASFQESRPAISEFGETPTARLVRHGSLEATTSRLSQQGSRHDDIHEEVESILSRLQQRHAYAEVPIDTSHLDLEEMRMIQKALEENPSPPPSPMDFEAPETTTESNFDENSIENILETSDMTDVVLESVNNIDEDKDKNSLNEFGPLSPVQEDIETETGTPGPDSDHNETVHTVFDEFVSTVNEEHTLNLPRGYIFGNR